MTNLLPLNATQLEHDLADTIARLSEINVSPVSAIWNADTCPVPLLPWLAWAEQVPEWSSNWSVTTQRAVIKATRTVRRRRGTAGAVKEALRSLGLGVQLEEWYQQEPPGAPGTFRLNVELSERGLSAEEQESIERVVHYTKNARSHWDVMNVVLTQTGNTYYGSAVQSGDETTVYPLIITELAEIMPLLLASAMYDAETTTIYPLVAA